MDQDSKRSRRLEENEKQVRNRGSSTSLPNTVTDTCEKIGESLMEHIFTLVLRALLLVMQRNNDPELRHEVVKNFARDCQQTKMIQKFLTQGSWTEYEATLARPGFLRRPD